MAIEHAQFMHYIRGRTLLFCFAVSFIASLAMIAVASPSWVTQSPRPPLPDAAFGLIFYALLLTLVMILLARDGGSLARVMGRRPDATAIRWAVASGLALFGLSMASLYAIFLPLSYIAPGFVDWWLFQDQMGLIWTDGDAHAVANTVQLLVGVVLGPFVEEVFFRGLLLTAWLRKMRSTWAVVWCSSCFALLHADLMGSFVFGVVTSLAFLRTGALWISVVIHVTNNALVWTLTATSLVFFGATDGGLAEFQASWWVGLAGLLGLPLLIRACGRSSVLGRKNELTRNLA